MRNIVEYKSITRDTIQNVVQRLDQEKNHSQDMIVPASEIAFNVTRQLGTPERPVAPAVEGIRKILDEKDMLLAKSPLLRKAEENLSSKLRIPISFFDYLKTDHPSILEYNLNHLSNEYDGNFMIRSFRSNSPFLDWAGDEAWPAHDNKRVIRSVLSDRFKRIDNFDVLGAVMQAINESGVTMQVASGSLTENHMFIDFVATNPQAFPDFLEEYRNPEDRRGNNFIVSGFSIRNSETGSSRFKIVPRMVVLACDNGLTIRKDAMARTHLGSKVDHSGILWSADTVDKEMKLIIAQTRDAIKTFLSPEYLGQKVSDIMRYRKDLDHPHHAAQHLAKELSFDQQETAQLVEALFGSGDKTTTGLLHASTWVAQKLPVERQYEVEETAMDLLPTMTRFDREKMN